jgi:N-acetylglucosaminyldiphosphoundecaprenol N-acetyl-beta-D-mannosaminyltransferase
MLMLCEKAAEEKISIYLYGSTEPVLKALQKNLTEKFPTLLIAGSESPPFRSLTKDEDNAVIGRINKSKAGLVFLGLGCPKQELFAYQHKHKICAVQLCVGAAFDFHAGMKPQAPVWMQKNGLEWLYRLSTEPKRLLGRYITTNSFFVGCFIKFALLKNHQTSKLLRNEKKS